MTLDAAGRAQRAEGQRLFDRLAERYAGEEQLGRTSLFGSAGLSHQGSIVGREGQLVVKLDAAGLQDVIAAGPTVPVHIGRGIAKASRGLALHPGSGHRCQMDRGPRCRGGGARTSS